MTAMMAVRKKPVVVHAVQWDGTEKKALEILEEIGNWRGSYYEHQTCFEKEPGSLVIETLEGSMLASPGDWIIKGVNGEYYPVKDEIFRKTYEIEE